MKRGRLARLTLLLASLAFSGFPSCSSIESKLKEGEYAVPRDVMHSYLSVLDPLFFLIMDPGAIQVSNPIEEDMQNSFMKKLENYTLEKREYFRRIFTTKKNIIVLEDYLDSPLLPIILKHERFHREFTVMRESNPQTYRVMIDAAKNLIIEKIVEENPKSLHVKGTVIRSVERSLEEFYVYLADGEFAASAEEALREKYPESYKAFLCLRERSNGK